FPFLSNPQKNKEVFSVLVSDFQIETAAQFFKKYPSDTSICHWLPSLHIQGDLMVPLIPLAKACGEDLEGVKISRYGGEPFPLIFYAIHVRKPELVRALLEADISCERYFQGKNVRIY